MKTLLLVLLAVFSISAHARGPGGDPVIPWPTFVSLTPVTCEQLQGDWVAYDHNSIWFVNLEMREGDALSTLRIKSNALFTHKATGWLEADGPLFYGKIAMDPTHFYDVIVFRDLDGTKIRIIKGPQKYFDLKLYRRE